MADDAPKVPGDILDMRYARPPDGPPASAVMVVGEDGEPTVLGPCPNLAPIRDLLMQRFPDRWPDQMLAEMHLAFLHSSQMTSGRSAAGFDYPESGSLMP